MVARRHARTLGAGLWSADVDVAPYVFSLSLSLPIFLFFFFLGRFFTRRVFLVPIGANKDLGMFYPRNPRFDEDGRWMPRKEWPTELQ